MIENGQIEQWEVVRKGWRWVGREMECRDRPPRIPLLSKVRELLPKAGVLTQGGKGDTEQRHPVSDFQQTKHLCQHVLRVNTAIPDRLPETKINGTASWKYAKEHMTGDMVLKKKTGGSFNGERCESWEIPGRDQVFRKAER